MKVISKSGLRVPKEGAPRQYITEATAVDVPASAYYLRRVAEGDLIVKQESVDTTPKKLKGVQ